MGSGNNNNKIIKFLCNPKNVKKRRNTRLVKCYGHVNIAIAIKKTVCVSFTRSPKTVAIEITRWYESSHVFVIIQIASFYLFFNKWSLLDNPFWCVLLTEPYHFNKNSLIWCKKLTTWFVEIILSLCCKLRYLLLLFWTISKVSIIKPCFHAAYKLRTLSVFLFV